MTPAEKEQVYKLRLEGLGYKAIANEVLITVDAVKGYCKRHHLNDQDELAQMNAQATINQSGLCLQCKKLIRQKKRGRAKKFCSDA